MGHALSDAERRDWLRLARTDLIGPVTFWALLARFRTVARALEAAPEIAHRAGGRRIVPPSPAAIDEECARAEAFGASFLCAGEARYPHALALTDPAPPVIVCAGDLALLARPMVAIVGARNASANGQRLARDLAEDLGRAGYVIASGLARGIDTAAHRGSLPTGTVAVMAGGIDSLYPPENQDLYDRIRATGVLLSEMPMGLQPQARHFPRRNRIISGLALGLLVVEAALNSGSLITARFALEQNRDVFAVPGSPLDPRARGTNGLIRDGAVLTETAGDILATLEPGRLFRLRPTSHPLAEPDVPGLDDSAVEKLRLRLLELLGPAPSEIDDLIRLCDGDSAGVQAALLELDLAGRIERLPGQRVSLVS